MSRDAPESPLIDALVAAGRALSEQGLGAGVVSARHGLRCAVSAPGALGALDAAAFSEVVDYDPHGDRLVLLGRESPGPWGAVHALVYRARGEVGAMVQADADGGHPAHDALPTAARGATPVETALAVLELLRDHDAVSLDGRALLAVGATPEAAKAALLRALQAGPAAEGEGTGEAAT